MNANFVNSRLSGDVSFFASRYSPFVSLNASTSAAMNMAAPVAAGRVVQGGPGRRIDMWAGEVWLGLSS